MDRTSAGRLDLASLQERMVTAGEPERTFSIGETPRCARQSELSTITWPESSHSMI